ncbi:Crp/Fnr family transcriptional regulator [Vibrio tasmaniensis]|uniref:Crp/Fnr family transcriptional regulator n=1 Tax=Vibrio tasmaniensis TaxID=212663 RepID=UPI00107F74C9|nr:Crp/Fnr family transcriptional regulator [Vibrio tasmaniensis]
MNNSPCTIFEGLEINLINRINELSELQVGIQGIPMCHNFENPPGVYFILEGVASVIISTNDISSESGCFVGVGDNIGAEFIFNDNLIFFSMTEIKPIKLLYLSKESVIEILRFFPEFHGFLYKEVSRMSLKSYQQNLISIHDKNFRTVYFIVDLYYQFKKCGVSGYRINISQSLLASVVRISRPKLNFVLKSFEAQNLITTRRGEIIIEDLDSLKSRLDDGNLMFFNPMNKIA